MTLRPEDYVPRPAKDRRVQWYYALSPVETGWQYTIKVRARPWRPWGPKRVDRGFHPGPKDAADQFVAGRINHLLDSFGRRRP
jgi:hypothetical protein